MSQLANRVMYASSKRSRREMHFFEEGAAENTLRDHEGQMESEERRKVRYFFPRVAGGADTYTRRRHLRA